MKKVKRNKTENTNTLIILRTTRKRNRQHNNCNTLNHKPNKGSFDKKKIKNHAVALQSNVLCLQKAAVLDALLICTYQ